MQKLKIQNWKSFNVLKCKLAFQVTEEFFKKRRSKRKQGKKQ